MYLGSNIVMLKLCDAYCQRKRVCLPVKVDAAVTSYCTKYSLSCMMKSVAAEAVYTGHSHVMP